MIALSQLFHGQAGLKVVSHDTGACDHQHCLKRWLVPQTRGDEGESDSAYAWEAESREKQWLPTIDVRSRKGRDIDGIEKVSTACRKR